MLIMTSLALMLYKCGERKSEQNNNTGVDSAMIIETKKTVKFVNYLRHTVKALNDSTDIKIFNIDNKNTRVIKQFYKLEKYTPIWISNNKSNERTNTILNLFKNAAAYGLDSSFYSYSKLKKIQKSLEKDTVFKISNYAKFEVLLTGKCLEFMSHLRGGVIYPDTLVYGQVLSQYPDSFYIFLSKSIKKNDFRNAVLSIQPNFEAYKKLQSGLEKFVAENEMSKKKIFLPNYKTDSVRCYTKTKEVLIQNNYLSKQGINLHFYAEQLVNELSNIEIENKETEIDILKNNEYDSLFFEALKRFQKNHGLNPDGKIGKNSYNALRKNNYDRYVQAIAGMERLRWERRLPTRYVYVNIPTYKMQVIKNDSIKIEFKIVVGTPKKATPTLNSLIKTIITYPDWHVPYSISSKELLPKIKKDSTYLKRNNYVLMNKQRQAVNAEAVNWKEISGRNFEYYIKQKSGRRNALGNVKFIFPNEYSVYLHDTQSRHLFNNEIRAYSHGCMRLHNPIGFGEYLLQNDNNNKIHPDTFKLFMQNRTRKYINLNKPLPIYVRYVTCVGNDEDELIFYKDIYKKDKKIAEQILAQKKQ